MPSKIIAFSPPCGCSLRVGVDLVALLALVLVWLLLCCCAAYLVAVCPGARLVAPERPQITIYNHISGIIQNRVKYALIIDINQ